MSRKKKHLFFDAIFLVLSIAFAVYIAETGIAHKFVSSFNEYELLGILIAGFFFTSVFTTAPAIILLGQFAETAPLSLLTLLGGLGAVLGDFIIFKLARNRIAYDIKYLTSLKKFRLPGIFRTKLFHFFVPFIGALIIASPLPDEIGVTMLGLSKVKPKIFFLISFIFNSLGIYIIGTIAKAVA